MNKKSHYVGGSADTAVGVFGLECEYRKTWKNKKISVEKQERFKFLSRPGRNVGFANMPFPFDNFLL